MTQHRPPVPVRSCSAATSPRGCAPLDTGHLLEVYQGRAAAHSFRQYLPVAPCPCGKDKLDKPKSRRAFGACCAKRADWFVDDVTCRIRHH